jgi:molybdopterin molybdotransferase
VREFIPFEEALDTVLHHTIELDSEVVPLDRALGRVIARSVSSPIDIPPFDNAAMDGYAVRLEDTSRVPVALRVVADIPAGTPFDVDLEPGTCARIMTGAPVPGGADAVVPVEWTDGFVDVGSDARFHQSATTAVHIRRAGEDVRQGQEVLLAGKQITPPVVGLLASLGVVDVSVARQPVVAVIATGDELVDPAREPGPGQIRNSNGPALTAQVESAGARASGPFHARDNRESIRDALREALGADIIVISGGVSVGSYDLVQEELNRAGLKVLFWKVKQRPGKPLVFGTLNGKPVIGLPGNPVSSAICFEQYVRPAIRKMMGCTKPIRERSPATLTDAITTPRDLHVFARGICHIEGDGLKVASTGPQGSHVSTSMVAANCIIHLPPGRSEFEVGDHVQVEWLEW